MIKDNEAIVVTTFYSNWPISHQQKYSEGMDGKEQSSDDSLVKDNVLKYESHNDILKIIRDGFYDNGVC